MNQIKTNLTDVQANLTTFANDAKGQWQAQTSALKSATAKLDKAAKNMTANPGISALAGVTTALGDREHGSAESAGRGEHALPGSIPRSERVSSRPAAAAGGRATGPAAV